MFSPGSNPRSRESVCDLRAVTILGATLRAIPSKMGLAAAKAHATGRASPYPKNVTNRANTFRNISKGGWSVTEFEVASAIQLQLLVGKKRVEICQDCQTNDLTLA